MAARDLEPPTFPPPGRRTLDEIERIRAWRVEKAKRWFAAAAEGAEDRHCNICGYRGRFAPVRHKVETWCPACDSRPRHRLMALWLKREAPLRPGLRILHFAAEAWMRDIARAAGCFYETADLNDRFDRQLDITAMGLPAEDRDMIIAHHVLEHVDDRAALAELFRVLRPGGRAVLTLPIIEGWEETLELGRLPEREARRYYGDPDHLRFYGRDVRARIAAAGFGVEEFAAVEPDVSNHALNRGERIFIGVKPE
ncbi:MAG: methyltransferase domain-containing protein [Pseudomonadota bacterium]